ncbi:pyridoxamine 5'-phosphate oxidase family protein [Herbiconiux moechotypicola]|uniref:Pyridoxamine 5'-phosphate oxidase n=1 Tax=Herbiconiux moechotypicola TaxID=637393 RepID=A0ABP5QJ66_9MICO|nr:pyridoxamine 5'-phosphate oxidase family protein [Herbiconiux moechotypicola]MCS5730400.1 pyridoxamine 5'-phosphate oxidase family protein [Herbiconiux moechotypicola]
MPPSTLDPRVAFPATPADSARLDAGTAPAHPLALLSDWIEGVVARDAVEPFYVTLATASADGVPSSRTVQLLDVEEDALLFTTNFGSRKGVEMRATGRAAVSLYWRETAQSVNVTGRVVEADDAECDARFAEEARGVQVSRTVSFHGLPLDDEAEQLGRFSALMASDEPVERPEYWRWFRIVPDAVTFWEGNPEALNRRLHYAWHDGAWTHGAIQA